MKEADVLVDRGSGWTPDDFKEAASFAKNTSDTLENLGIKVGRALAPIQSFLNGDTKGNKALHSIIEVGDSYRSLLNLTKSNYEELVKVVNKVKKCFVEKR